MRSSWRSVCALSADKGEVRAQITPTPLFPVRPSRPFKPAEVSSGSAEHILLEVSLSTSFSGTTNPDGNWCLVLLQTMKAPDSPSFQHSWTISFTYQAAGGGF